jgi:glycerol uptake facilitator-like aquaporin
MAWVLALDMRSKTIQKVGEFNPARTLGLAWGYNASGFSKYLKGNWLYFM